jgi:hypothetical protein
MKSTYRYLYKKEKLYKLETLILSFIRKIPGMNDSESISKNLIILRERMIKLKNDPYERNAFEYFDFIKWVDSKIEK